MNMEHWWSESDRGKPR